MKHIYEMAAKHPEKIERIIDNMAEEFGEEIYEYFNCHIKDEAEYEKYVSVLKNFDKTTGGHWNLATIADKTGIDFNEKDYTLYDYAYAVNMKYSDEGDLMIVDNIFRAAQRYLEDDDCGEIPSERSYHEGKKRYMFYSKK